MYCQYTPSHRLAILSYRLAQRSALYNGNCVTLHNTESWADVCGKIGVTFLVSGILWNEVEVFSADNEGSVHLGGHDGAGQDATSD